MSDALKLGDAQRPQTGSDAKDIMKDYTMLNIIGSGSFGKVHKVQSKTDSKVYACKEIDYAKMSEKEKKLLVHEVNTLKDLHHLNIVRYIDRYLDKPRFKIFIVMEYCENGDLARYIKRHKQDRRYIAEDKIWSVLVQLLQALHYCHTFNTHSNGQDGKAQKVIHRDIKPGNVMLSRDGSIKLGDFGLCRTLGELSQAQTNVGTPLYMAPEVLQKQPYTEKADVWSLGCVIYELCALQPPFVASNMDSLKIKVKQGVKPPIPSHYSVTLKNVIDSMLCNSQTNRPSCSQLLATPKIIEMAERMSNAGMTAKPLGAAANPPPAPAPAAVPPPVQVVQPEVIVNLKAEAAAVGLKRNLSASQKERDLLAWEEALNKREQALRMREEQLESEIQDLKKDSGKKKQGYAYF